jgi:uncharacterized protein (DUF2249 family)
MNPNTETIDLTHFDVRDIPCRTKHAQIFQRWTDLPVGAYFVLINDHDPVPLYYQFDALFRGAFSWEYLVDGPAEFHVKITRLAASPSGSLPLPPRRAVTAQAGTTGDLDLRGLEPPEPMLRILTTLEAMPAGSSFRARTDRQPIHLFPELLARGASYTSEAAADGSWITTVTPA